MAMNEILWRKWDVYHRQKTWFRLIWKNEECAVSLLPEMNPMPYIQMLQNPYWDDDITYTCHYLDEDTQHSILQEIIDGSLKKSEYLRRWGNEN